MSKIDELKSDLSRLRDEAKVQVELGKMELREEWNELEAKWNHFVAEARLQESKEQVKASLAALAEELRKAYQRLKSAL
ncbi:MULTISPECIES: hypothetical protein [Sphingobium]|uniref:Uncharacterized protein n=3 Tax=Sphingobium TaxID=165695 RepID=A0A8E0WVI9_9SPHN|nr:MULTISPECIES: hypothetical protein [Sphingobium]EQB12986.1 hypothetical protein RLDS_17975 [Sphingobium lactosutens DS20]KER38144.1 hypothetical protein AL00_02105 [Sphingobium indicum F2]